MGHVTGDPTVSLRRSPSRTPRARALLRHVFGASLGLALLGSAASCRDDDSSEGPVLPRSPEVDASASGPSRENDVEAGASTDAYSSGKTDASGEVQHVPLAPAPPGGSIACGSGAFTVAAAVAECQSNAGAFDGLGANVGCGELTMSAGRWEAWCTEDSVYVAASFEGVRVSGSALSCKVWHPYPFYRAVGSTGLITPSGAQKGFALDPVGSFSDTPTSASLWVTLPKTAAAKGPIGLLLAATPDGTAPGCSSGALTPRVFLVARIGPSY